MTKAVQSVDVRASIVETFRRDLIGPNPGPEDADIAKERLNENPSRWYLAGFLAPAEDEMAMNAPEEDDDPGAQEERENQTDLVEEAGADLAANGRRRYAFDDGKAGDVTPIRFVCACEKGHLQDIDWRRVVHGPDRCQEPMWVEEKGTSADPRAPGRRARSGGLCQSRRAFRRSLVQPCAGRKFVQTIRSAPITSRTATLEIVLLTERRATVVCW
jgi:hypothetical protein